MVDFNLAAVCTFGLESVLKNEIINLGYKPEKIENGRVYFRSDILGIARSNIFLRTADRIHIVLNEFPASDFDRLFEGVSSIPWENIIDINGMIVVKGRSNNSKLHSVPVCQSMTKKAIIERLRLKLNKTDIIEDGTLFPVEIELDRDTARVTLNTSGEPLNKRGYREDTGEAPIKETLAAGLILLSRWNPDEPFIDPFCGSGTIPIEAAMIKKNIAPGLNRHFLSMKWNFIDKKIWNLSVEEAMDSILSFDSHSIFGYDSDPEVIKKAEKNSASAEVDDVASFKNVDINILKLKSDTGFIVTNPPYGERIGDRNQIDGLYDRLVYIVGKKPGWSVNIITDHPEFQEMYGTADKKRKLYNGNIKCNYYSYYPK